MEKIFSMFDLILLGLYEQAGAIYDELQHTELASTATEFAIEALERVENGDTQIVGF